jgi:hypothetical protein
MTLARRHRKNGLPTPTPPSCAAPRPIGHPSDLDIVNWSFLADLTKPRSASPLTQLVSAAATLGGRVSSQGPLNPSASASASAAPDDNARRGSALEGWTTGGGGAWEDLPLSLEESNPAAASATAPPAGTGGRGGGVPPHTAAAACPMPNPPMLAWPPPPPPAPPPPAPPAQPMHPRHPYPRPPHVWPPVPHAPPAALPQHLPVPAGYFSSDLGVFDQGGAPPTAGQQSGLRCWW